MTDQPVDTQRMIAAIKSNPASARHLTAELEALFADEDSGVRMRANLIFADAVAADPMIAADSREASREMAKLLRAYLRGHTQ